MTRRAVQLAGIIALAFTLVACTAGPSELSPPATAPSEVEARMGDLVPTATVDAQVVSSPTVLVQSSSLGRVGRIARPGSTVKIGQLVATVGSKPTRAPADGVVTRALAEPGQTVPVGLPLVELKYSGFALTGSVPAGFPWPGDTADVHARAQLTEAAGPFSCTAVVTLPTLAEPGQRHSGARRACIVPKSIPVEIGSAGLFVVTAPTLTQVVLVPTSAVAGRQGTGTVTVMEGGRRVSTTVNLGPSDGTDIQVTSGLVAGQRIAAVAPNLETPHT